MTRSRSRRVTRAMDTVAVVERDVYSEDLPCQCGAKLGEHTSEEIATWPYTRRMHKSSGCTGFQHAETPACEPDPKGDVGHLYRGYDRRLYRVARLVRFRNTSGLDYEIEPFADDPKADLTTKFSRRCVSAGALGRAFHHSCSCPCGGGYAR